MEFRFTRNLNKAGKADPESPKKRVYPGMKKKPKFGPDKDKPKKYRDMLPFEGRPRPNLTPWQITTFNSFIKPKSGETEEEWKKRTRCRRILSDEEIEASSANNKFRIRKKKATKHALELANKIHDDQSEIRDFEFMKYYGIVINFYAIKYGIRKDDLELGFYFYENTPFLREKFENACVLSSGYISGKFKRFLDNGYLVPMFKIDKTLKRQTRNKTGLYKLSKNFARQLTIIYKVLAKVNPLRVHRQKEMNMLDDDVKQLFIDMNQEMMEIKMGKKPQEKLEP